MKDVRSMGRFAAAFGWGVKPAPGFPGLKNVRKLVGLLAGSVLVLLAGVSVAGERFDGNWNIKLTCPAKGNTEGYTWEFPGVIQNSNLHGEHGTAGEPGYLLIEGKIAEDGRAKLSASGVVASRKYARGITAHKGEEYGYEIKAQFKEKEGTGVRNVGMGFVGRPCTFDFVKQEATSPAGGH